MLVYHEQGVQVPSSNSIHCHSWGRNRNKKPSLQTPGVEISSEHSHVQRTTVDQA